MADDTSVFEGCLPALMTPCDACGEPDFDALAEKGGELVDASGTLPGAGQFRGPDGLEDALLDRPELFVATLTEKLLTFALGRGVEYYDAPAVRKIVRDAERDDYRFSALILGIVESLPFQMRSTEPKKSPARRAIAGNL